MFGQPWQAPSVSTHTSLNKVSGHGWGFHVLSDEGMGWFIPPFPTLFFRTSKRVVPALLSTSIIFFGDTWWYQISDQFFAWVNHFQTSRIIHVLYLRPLAGSDSLWRLGHVHLTRWMFHNIAVPPKALVTGYTPEIMPRLLDPLLGSLYWLLALPHEPLQLAGSSMPPNFCLASGS